MEACQQRKSSKLLLDLLCFLFEQFLHIDMVDKAVAVELAGYLYVDMLAVAVEEEQKLVDFEVKMAFDTVAVVGIDLDSMVLVVVTPDMLVCRRNILVVCKQLVHRLRMDSNNLVAVDMVTVGFLLSF